MSIIRVMVVDDQTLVRQGIAGLLQLAEGVEVAGFAVHGLEALERLDDIKPDVMLLDLRMPQMNGIELLQRLATESRLPPTIILTTFDDDELVLAGLNAGAKGYLLKDVTLEDLVFAIHAVADGRTLMKPAVTSRVLEGLKNLPTDFSSLEQPDPLTDRESEILRLMAGGYSNKEIARALDVAEGTIKNHVSNVLSKFGVRDRTRAVLKALELGIV